MLLLTRIPTLHMHLPTLLMLLLTRIPTLLMLLLTRMPTLRPPLSPRSVSMNRRFMNHKHK
jgi:hypothetical protein